MQRVSRWKGIKEKVISRRGHWRADKSLIGESEGGERLSWDVRKCTGPRSKVVMQSERREGKD